MDEDGHEGYTVVMDEDGHKSHTVVMDDVGHVDEGDSYNRSKRLQAAASRVK